MLTVLGGLAEFERELIKARTAEGRARAVAKGVRLGRRPKLDEEQRRVACERKQRGEDISVIARDYNVSDATILRIQCG
jgi:DNA invertase Pin-like site-specific DNA recombinase